MFCPGSGADRRTGRRHGIAQGRPGRGSNPQPLSNKPYGLLDVGASALRFPLAHPSSQCGHGSSSTPTATCSSRRPTTPPPSVSCASAGSCVPPRPPCICSAADSHGRRPTALTDRTPRSRAIGHPPAGLASLPPSDRSAWIFTRAKDPYLRATPDAGRSRGPIPAHVPRPRSGSRPRTPARAR